jgi:tol-pal system protein YbgF
VAPERSGIPALTQQNAQQALTARMDALEHRVDALEAQAAEARAATRALAEATPGRGLAAAAPDGSEDIPEAEAAKAAPAPAAPAEAPAPAPKAEAPAPAPQAKAEAPASGKPWEAYPEVRAKTPAKAASPTQPSAATKAPAAPATKARAKAPAPATGKAAYDAALRLVLDGKAAQGRAAMERFLAAEPASPLAPNARYWVGETYYHEGDDAEAIVAFKTVHQQFPRHSKAAAALLKIGYAYERLGDTANARFYLQVLTQDYRLPRPQPWPASAWKA